MFASDHEDSFELLIRINRHRYLQNQFDHISKWNDIDFFQRFRKYLFLCTFWERRQQIVNRDQQVRLHLSLCCRHRGSYKILWSPVTTRAKRKWICAGSKI